MNGSDQKETSKQEVFNSYIGHYNQAQPFLREQHIVGGYRINFHKTIDVVKSLFMIHNQTVNIWSHLLGAILFFFIIFEAIAYKIEQSHIIGKALIKNSIYDFTKSRVQYSPEVPTWPIMFALLGGSICLSCSTVFHWLHPINQKIFKISHSLDFAGIGINMAFSPIPAFYYSMYCHKSTAITYITIIILAGTATFSTNLIKWFEKEQNKIYKIVIFMSSSIVCVIGLIHLLINQFVFDNFGDEYSIKPSLYFYVGTLLCYLFGFLFYLFKCPQRHKPGQFDICGQSHQIWHLFVFLAILFTYLGSIASFQVRSAYPLCKNNHSSDIFEI